MSHYCHELFSGSFKKSLLPMAPCYASTIHLQSRKRGNGGYVQAHYRAEQGQLLYGAKCSL